MLTLSYPPQLAQATVTNTSCPSIDPTSYNYRGIWSILASCGLTLLICVWHAVHPALPLPHHKWYHVFLYRVLLMLLAFFVPEYLATCACDEWVLAQKIRRVFHSRGYKWWTMTHSYFMVMGGLAIRVNEGIIAIDRYQELLELLDGNNLINPIIAKADIMDKSDSDGLGKAILVMQLFWFATQLVVRHLNHLSVTLVELDTICIALLTFLLLFFWWEKPCCPRRPYILYARNLNDYNYSQEMLGEGDSLTRSLDISTMKTKRNWRDLLELTSEESGCALPVVILFLVWSLFGVFHAMAWNYEFPTKIEKILWCGSSLALAGSAAIFYIIIPILRALDTRAGCLVGRCMYLFMAIGAMARVYLVVGMLASLRSLPLSAYETIPWTNYIPHL